MFSPYLTQGDIRLDSCVADGGHRLGTASGGEAVNSPLTQRLRLPETLAQSPQMKAKPVMTNKLGPAYTEMEPADVFTVCIQK